MTQNLNPPAHLAPETAGWWKAVLQEFVLEPHHMRLLRLACEAWDGASKPVKSSTGTG